MIILSCQVLFVLFGCYAVMVIVWTIVMFSLKERHVGIRYTLLSLINIGTSRMIPHWFRFLWAGVFG